MLRNAAELAIRRPRTVVAVWAVVLVVGLGLGGSVFGKLGGLGANVPGSQSQVTASRLDKLDPGADTIDGLVTSSTAGRVIAADTGLRSRVAAAVADLRSIPGVAQVPDPYQTPGATGDGQVIAIPVTFVSGIASHDEDVALKAAQDRLHAVATPGFQVRVGGGPLTGDALSHTAQSDASKAEMISLPIVLLLLVVVFGGLLAASLPLVLAVCGVASTLLVLLRIQLRDRPVGVLGADHDDARPGPRRGLRAADGDAVQAGARVHGRHRRLCTEHGLGRRAHGVLLRAPPSRSAGRAPGVPGAVPVEHGARGDGRGGGRHAGGGDAAAGAAGEVRAPDQAGEPAAGGGKLVRAVRGRGGTASAAGAAGDRGGPDHRGRAGGGADAEPRRRPRAPGELGGAAGV